MSARTVLPGPVNRSVQTLPIDEALPEGSHPPPTTLLSYTKPGTDLRGGVCSRLHGKGDLALFLHVIAVSRDAQASRDVLKLFRAILERP
eukprot:3254801-Rhodomonas_salina.2